MMFEDVDIGKQLKLSREKKRKGEDMLLAEARQILKKDLFVDEKILQNLKQYKRSFEVINEEDVDQAEIFTIYEIRDVAVRHRLKFLESRFYKPEIPYEAVLKIKELNRMYSKDLKIFRVLSIPEAFSGKENEQQRSLFVKTNYDNYFLLHRWGKPISWYRKIKFAPLRRFETLALTILLFTLALTLALPTYLITLDREAEYWSGYRAATFFHLLFFDTGVTAYVTFAFGMNFNSSIWNRHNDFD